MIGDYQVLCNGFDPTTVNDHRSLRLALILLGRIKRHPQSVYRSKLLVKLSQEPENDQESDELDELEFLGWTPETYAIKENTDAVLSLRHVILVFMSSFGKKGKEIEPPEPAYRPGLKKPNSGSAGSKKKDAYAGQKVYTLDDMDEEFFAAHKTEYGA